MAKDLIISVLSSFYLFSGLLTIWNKGAPFIRNAPLIIHSEFSIAALNFQLSKIPWSSLGNYNPLLMEMVSAEGEHSIINHFDDANIFETSITP